MEWKSARQRFRVWSRKPPNLLLFVWCLAVQVTVIAFAISRRFADWVLVYTLGLASATAIAGTDIALWVQSYYSGLSQNRQFNRDIEVRYFEEIYGPLYEELSRVADDLKGNDWPTLVEWPRIAKSRFGPVVDEIVSNLFIALSYRLVDYSRGSHRYFDAATRCIQQVIGGNADLDDMPDQGKQEIALALESDRSFIFDDSVSSLRESGLTRLEASLKGVLPDYKPEDAEDFIKRVKPVLRADPRIAEHQRTRDELYELATRLRAMVLDRMKPFHET